VGFVTSQSPRTLYVIVFNTKTKRIINKKREVPYGLMEKTQRKKLKEEQQKKLEDMKMKIEESITIFINLIKQYGENNIYSETEKIQLNLVFLSSTPEVQMVLKNINDAIQSMENTQSELNEDKWEYASPDSKLKYNPFEDEWEYAPPSSTLKYNPFSDSWSYE